LYELARVAEYARATQAAMSKALRARGFVTCAQQSRIRCKFRLANSFKCAVCFCSISVAMGQKISSAVNAAVNWVFEAVNGTVPRVSVFDKRTRELEDSIRVCHEKDENFRSNIQLLEIKMQSQRKQSKFLLQKLKQGHDVGIKRQACDSMREYKASQKKYNHYTSEHAKMQTAIESCENSLLNLQAGENIMMLAGPLQSIRVHENHDKVIDQHEENVENMQIAQEQADELHDATSFGFSRDDDITEEALLEELESMQNTSAMHDAVSNEGQLRVEITESNTEPIFTIDSDSPFEVRDTTTTHTNKPTQQATRAAPTRVSYKPPAQRSLEQMLI
jgi:hypothetical protein